MLKTVMSLRVLVTAVNISFLIKHIKSTSLLLRLLVRSQ